MNFIFIKETYIPFHLGDAAGILFFGHLFSLAHETYELFVQKKLTILWQNWFDHPDWIVPIKQTHSCYYHPVKVGSSYQIGLSIKKIGVSSFVLTYQLIQEQTLFCEVETVHVFCHRDLFQKIPIPPSVLVKLKKAENYCCND